MNIFPIRPLSRSTGCVSYSEGDLIFLLSLSALTFQAIPKRAFADASQVENLRVLLQSRTIDADAKRTVSTCCPRPFRRLCPHQRLVPRQTPAPLCRHYDCISRVLPRRGLTTHLTPAPCGGRDLIARRISRPGQRLAASSQVSGQNTGLMAVANSEQRVGFVLQQRPDGGDRHHARDRPGVEVDEKLRPN
jgi:hypothetical protein